MNGRIIEQKENINPREVPCLIHEEKKRKRDGEIPRLALKLRRIQGGKQHWCWNEYLLGP